jgi:hypothetical protein
MTLLTQLKKTRDAVPVFSLTAEKKRVRNNQTREDAFLDTIQSRNYEVKEIGQLYKEISSETHKTCHIIGLGWSLNDSKDSISNQDSFIIGMNYAALSDLKYDLYFLEQGICDDNETKLRKTILEKEIIHKAKRIYFKNTSGHKEIDYILSNYGRNVTYMRNYVIICRNSKNLKYWMKELLCYDSRYLKQYKSTITAAIAFAKNAGFKKIVIHGLDFGGAYFFDDKDQVKPEMLKYIPPKTSQSSSKKVHQTAASSTGIQFAIPIIKEILVKEGVQLFAATEKSPLSRILDVYTL